MASYTENYALTKPTMAESADIRVINSNMDRVDDVMHSTQVSLAPAYDTTQTYNTGDVVMHELLMYECLEDEVTGAWDSTKWQRTTAGEHGGGSDVEVTQIQTEGKAVASIAVDGVSTDILIPELKVYGEATGDLITIEDAMEAPLEECKVTLEPQQDLHGYDHPWAGGAGKNKLNFTDTTVTSSRTIISNISLKAGDYIVAFDIKNNSNIEGYYQVRIGTTGIGGANFGANYSGRLSKTFTLSEDSVINIIVAGASSGYTFEFSKGQIEQGSTATTYSPYSNICPISGHTEANVARCGKNLFDVSKCIKRGNYYTPNGTQTTDTNIKVAPAFWLKSGTYNISWNAKEGYTRVNILNIDKSFKERVITTNKGRAILNLTNSGFVQFAIDYSITNIQLEIGSTATSYEPYNGATYTIQLGSTCYGGELDAVNGVLKVTDGYIASYNGETLPSTWISDRDVYAPNTSPTTGAEVVYKLSTPTEVTLTPTEVTLLLGVNNLWSDGEMYVKYRRDIEMLLQRIADSLGGNA